MPGGHRCLAALACLSLFAAGACAAPSEPAAEDGATGAAEVPVGNTVGSVTILDDRAQALIPAGAEIEKLTDDMFQWSEGPVWISDGGYLLFSDVPQNTIFRWAEGEGASVWMQPSGYDGPDAEMFREAGTNGLIPAAESGAILVADHGNRMIAALDLETQQKTPLATTYEGKKFSSPNDLALASDGAVYFTDPPYGLAGMDESPHRELPFNGVYRLADGTVSLVDDSLSKPNGVILSPDETVLYVAQSDPEAAKIFKYDLGVDGLPTQRTVFADLTAEIDRYSEEWGTWPGLPDGMAMDQQGNLFATGPGGIRVFAPDGTLLAMISTGTPAANITFGDDGSTLYITSAAFLARVKLNTTGAGF